MNIFLAKRTAKHEADFLDGLAQAARDAGDTPRATPEKADLSIVWGWEPLLEGQPTLYVETGWLPRWTYQVAASPPNAQGARSIFDLSTTEEERRYAEAQLWRLRAMRPQHSAFSYADPWGLPVERCESFVLVPLQVEGDHNLARSPVRTMQELIDLCSAWDPACRLLFREHPARIAQHDHLELRRDCDQIEVADGRVTVHQYLKSKHCRAVITISSNVAHDACIWERPVAALGCGTWPDDLFRPLTNALLDPLSTYEREHRFAYVATLLARQWTLAEAKSAERYAAVVADAMAEVAC